MAGPLVANIADYADALLTARKARNILVLLLLLMLFFQLALFFTVRYKVAITAGNPSVVVTASTRQAPASLVDVLKYLTGLIDFAGVVVPLILAADLWLIVSIMLMGRLLGVAQMVSALMWSVALLVLLFPWQAFLENQTFTSTAFKIPGVLYTWEELAMRARLQPPELGLSILFWARFVAWPIVAILIVLLIQHLSGRGLRLAMGQNRSPVAASGTAEL